MTRLLTPAIISIVNLPLQSGVFPSISKPGRTPLLKKPDLDKDDLSNYRPITNLSFVSKILERIAAYQLDQYLSADSLLSPSQFATVLFTRLYRSSSGS